jgi:nitroimidazol reductase NimA-like FMN-containing flavoprotein (pyridoxamine 5'-phosphate oxidase superfamily)
MLIDEGLELLSETDCRELLSRGGLGRVGITMGALPVILPVTFAFIDDHIVFRTGRGTKLNVATSGNVVAFETDAYDEIEHCGWSVLAVGRASRVKPGEVGADAALLALKPWDNASAEYVRIHCEMLTGRRLLTR